MSRPVQASLQEPQRKRELSTREKIILLESSKLHGCKFPPWQDVPTASDFALSSPGDSFTDDTEFSLSAAQLEIFDRWERPKTQPLQDGHAGEHSAAPAQRQDLVQDIITDCSVVASLCAVTARSEHGHGDLFEHSFFPYDKKRCSASASENGKYIFRFYFNGCYRKIVTDDLLPVSKTSRSLHVIDRLKTTSYWPAIVEKAYLKTRGGYDFPGSNSGTDLWVLSGWVPEQIFLESDTVDRESLWHRLQKAFQYGDVLITMGTGKLSEKEEQGIGLIGEHDYAVIDLKKLHEQACFLVKNPWSNGRTWKGHVRRVDQDEMLQKKISGMNLAGHYESTDMSERLQPGTFWMPLTDVLQNFESIYLNWNPGLFSYREDVHFKWNVSSATYMEGYLGSNPQFTVQSLGSGSVWILLNRHFADDETSLASPSEGFISLYAFESGGRRVFLRRTSLAQSPYVDSPNSLLKLELKAGQITTLVVSHQELSETTHAFSLSALSVQPLTLDTVGDHYEYSASLHGAWTEMNSGGNASHPSYESNPQFKITLKSSADLYLLLENRVEKWPVHVNLVWANGKQVRAPGVRDIVGDSGQYRKGYAFAEFSRVEAGSYTIVCSTFERHQTGDFALRVGCSSPCQVSPVTVASAGRFTTRAGTIVFSAGEDQWMVPLFTSRLNRVSVSAMLPKDTLTTTRPGPCPLKISLELGRGPDKTILGASGEDEYADVRQSEISTPEFDVSPAMSSHGAWIVVERIGCSGTPADERIDVQILSEGPCSLGHWIKGERLF